MSTAMLTIKALASKSLALAGVTWSAIQTAQSVVTVLEPDAMLGLFGIPLVSKPLFFMALFGASGSVFFMQLRTAQNGGDPTASTSSGRALALALKMGGFAGSVLLFALLASSLVTILLDYMTEGPTIHSTPGWVCASFVLGVLIRFLPNKLVAAVERAIDITVDAYERVIGGGKP